MPFVFLSFWWVCMPMLICCLSLYGESLNLVSGWWSLHLHFLEKGCKSAAKSVRSVTTWSCSHALCLQQCGNDGFGKQEHVKFQMVSGVTLVHTHIGFNVVFGVTNGTPAPNPCPCNTGSSVNGFTLGEFILTRLHIKVNLSHLMWFNHFFCLL